jgi:hypothetical protein
MINWMQKLSSRKFWALLAGLAVAVMVLMGAPAESQTQVVSVIMALGSIAVYMWGEATVDAARLKAEVVVNNRILNQIDKPKPEVDPG